MEASALEQHTQGSTYALLLCVCFLCVRQRRRIHPCLTAALHTRGSSRCFAVPYTQVCIKTAAETEVRRRKISQRTAAAHM